MTIDGMRKAGYPFKIKGNDGYIAVLYGCQPLLDGDWMAIYKYPGGQCCHSLNDIRHFEIIEK